MHLSSVQPFSVLKTCSGRLYIFIHITLQMAYNLTDPRLTRLFVPPQPAVTLDVFIKQGVCRPRCTLQYLHTLYLCPVQGAATPLSATPARAGGATDQWRHLGGAGLSASVPPAALRDGPPSRSRRAGTPVDGSNWPPCQLISADGARQMIRSQAGEARCVLSIVSAGAGRPAATWTGLGETLLPAH